MSGPGWHKDDPAFNTPATKFVSDLECERDKALADAQKVEAERDELATKYEEARDARFEEGCDECEDRREAAVADLEGFKERLTQFADDMDDSARRPSDLTAAAVRAVKAQGIRDAIAASENPESTEEAPVRNWTDEEVIDFALNAEYPEDTESDSSVGVGVEGSDAGSRPRRDLALDADSSADEITLQLVEAMALIKPERVVEAEEFWGEAYDRAERKILAVTQPQTLAALDATPAGSEDTEKQSDLRSRSAIALVAGRLEGYADNLALPYPYNRNQLVEALREDAEKLKQSGGGECS